MAIITIIFAVVLPQFRVIQNGWDSRQAGTEVLQNGRVLIDHINRNLSKAVKITAVSDLNEPNGYIQFLDNDSNTYRYDINSTGSYVRYGRVGYTPSDLAGPVSSLTFTCYDACDIATADVNDIRYVEVETTLVNSVSASRNKTLIASAYLRTNSNVGNWCAYNDCVYDPGLVGYGTDPCGNSVHYGDTNHITVYGIGTIASDHQVPPGVGYSASSGQLKNYATGASTGVTATLTQSGGVVWQPMVGSVSGQNWTGGYDTAVCTDAYNTFHGIVDMTGTIYYGSAGWYVDVDFTGLDPSKTYTFATSASRAKSTTDGEPNGYPTRLSIYTISGIDAATNASTPGTTEVNSPYSVQFCTGNNHNEGYVARWVGINPGADGAFKVRATATPSVNQAYAFDVFMLQSADEVTQIAYPISYRDFNEAKAGSDVTFLAISTPSSTAVGDLLIAAVATDGSTTISQPSGWAEINNQGSDSNGQVTLGAWWRKASVAGATSHTFNWTGGGQQAYGWIMRFTGQNTTNPTPINASNPGQSYGTATPISPAVTTTTGCSMILRLGAFDDDGVTTTPEPGNPGLSVPSHTAITMDKSAATITSTVTFVAAGAVTSGTGVITPALPASIAVNDILLLFLETGNETITIPTPNGGTWTQVTNSPQGTGTTGATGTGTRLTAFWSRYNGTQGAPTTSDSNDHQMGRIVAFRGVVASGDPWDVTAGGVEGTPADTSGSIPGATTTVANTLVVAAIAASLPDSTSTTNFGTWTNANLTSIAERVDNARNAGNGGAIGIATGVKATAGAYANTTVTLATAALKGMMSIALKPSVTGTVSGGAGYVKQSTAGLSSGAPTLPTFALTAPNEARMLTIAIAPADANRNNCCGDVRP